MDLDKNRIKQSFATASVAYDKVAVLQRSVGLELLTTFNIENPNGIIMDLGCGTGFLTAELLGIIGTDLTRVIAVDIALPMLYLARNKLENKHNIAFICADAEFLPVADSLFTIVFSNLVFQWCTNIAVVFADIRRVIKNEGSLVFSTFGPQTLCELKSSWAAVDDHHHVNEFFSEEQLNNFLQHSGFYEVKIKTKLYTSTYQSVLELMRELKNMGAHNVISGRNKYMTTQKSMQNMINVYEKHRTNGMIPATFEIIMVYAKA